MKSCLRKLGKGKWLLLSKYFNTFNLIIDKLRDGRKSFFTTIFKGTLSKFQKFFMEEFLANFINSVFKTGCFQSFSVLLFYLVEKETMFHELVKNTAYTLKDKPPGE